MATSLTNKTTIKTTLIAGSVVGLVVGYIRRWQAAFAKSKALHPAAENFGGLFDPIGGHVDEINKLNLKLDFLKMEVLRLENINEAHRIELAGLMNDQHTGDPVNLDRIKG